jgi:putative glycosyltransferase
MKISVVTSLYQSAPYINEFHARHRDCLIQLGVDYEFIFVNDGSPDDSVAVTRQLLIEHPGIQLIRLSRNFGQHAAMFAGLAHADGDYVYAADCDLEEAPENLLLMFEMLRGDPDIDVIYGVLRKRTAGTLASVLSSLFYYVLNVLTEVKVPHNQTWQRIMSRQYVQELLRYQEVQALPVGLMALVGFNQQPLVVDKTYKGKTSYTLLKRTMLALSAIIAFSTKPLSWVCFTGLGLAGVSFSFILAICVAKSFGFNFQAGWSSLMASIWCVGGLVLFSIGIVGTYLARVFEQVKNRPRYIVKQILTSDRATERLSELN